MTRPHEQGYVELAGKTYAFRTPKVAIMLSAMIEAKGKSELEATQIMLAAQVRTMKAGLGKESWADVAKRFNDDEDPLDWPDLQRAFEEKMGDAAGRPTTSSDASSAPQPTTINPADEPSQPDSIFGI